MRNKDGVSEKMGCLKHLLGFSTGILAAGAYFTGNKRYGSARDNAPYFQYIQDNLNLHGYTGFEYMGYIGFYHYDHPDRSLWQRTPLVTSEDTLKAFFQFKESRFKRVSIRMRLIDKEYQAERSVGYRTCEEVFEGLSGNCGYKMEILMRYSRDFSDDFMASIWNKYNYGIGDKFRMTPELIVVCSSLRLRFQTEGGENGFTSTAFAPTS